MVSASVQPAAISAHQAWRRSLVFTGVLLCCTIILGFWYSGWIAAPFQGLVILLGLAVPFALTGFHQVYNDKLKSDRALHADALRTFIEGAVDLFFETDLEGRIVSIGGRLSGRVFSQPGTLIGTHYMNHIEMEPGEINRMKAARVRLDAYSDIQAIIRDLEGRRLFISLSAAPQYDQTGSLKGYFGIGTNVTERMRDQQKLRYVAEHDVLTGLANRFYFTQRIADDLRRRQPDQCLALMAIDLDGFKGVNDTYGHQAGDALLKLVAKRLMSHVRDMDWAARLGGDEFVFVSRHLANPMAACLIASRLVAVFEKPYRIGGLVLKVEASIGVACSPQHGTSTETLMKRADIALYQAKNDGRGCYRLYQPAADEDEAERLEA